MPKPQDIDAFIDQTLAKFDLILMKRFSPELTPYQCILIDVTFGGKHGLDHELVAILLVRVVLKGLQTH